MRKELAGRSDSLSEADLQSVPVDANLAGGETGAAVEPGAARPLFGEREREDTAPSRELDDGG